MEKKVEKYRAKYNLRCKYFELKNIAGTIGVPKISSFKKTKLYHAMYMNKAS